MRRCQVLENLAVKTEIVFIARINVLTSHAACQKSPGLFLDLYMAASHPGSTGRRRSLLEAQHENVIFNDLYFVSLRPHEAQAEQQTCLKELSSDREKHKE